MQMSQPIFLPEYNSEPILALLNHIVSPSHNPSIGLPRHKFPHLLPPLLTDRLHQTILIGITFGGTDEGGHHDIFGDSFMSVFCLVVDDEKIAISTPTEHGSRVDNFLLLIYGNLVDEVELVVELNYCFVFGHQINIFLG